MKKININNFRQAFIYTFIPFVIGFILSCLFRTMNAVLAPTLSSQLGFNARTIGLLTAVFFLAYGIFQIPLGILLDRYGPRRVQTSLFITAGFGLILFSLSTNAELFCIARILLGIGMAGGLMSALKIIAQWFPKEKIAMLNAIMMMSGGVGILLSVAPTQYLVDNMGWQKLNLFFAVITFGIAGLIYFIVPENEAGIDKNSSLKMQIVGVFNIFRDPFFIRIAPLTACILGTFIAFQALWAQAWFTTVSNLSLSKANDYLMIIAIGVTLSLLVTGYIANWSKRYDIKLTSILSVFALIYISTQCAILFGINFPGVILWFIYGFMSHIFNICYAMYANYFPKEYSARANAAQVVLTYLVVFVAQYLMGLIINLWPKINGKYPPSAYEFAFLVIIIIQLLAFLWFWLAGFFRIKPILANEIT